jgi:hypothetical protein
VSAGEGVTDIDVSVAYTARPQGRELEELGC